MPSVGELAVQVGMAVLPSGNLPGNLQRQRGASIRRKKLACICLFKAFRSVVGIQRISLSALSPHIMLLGSQASGLGVGACPGASLSVNLSYHGGSPAWVSVGTTSAQHHSASGSIEKYM